MNKKVFIFNYFCVTTKNNKTHFRFFTCLQQLSFIQIHNNESTFYKTDVIPIKKICDYGMLGK